MVVVDIEHRDAVDPGVAQAIAVNAPLPRPLLQAAMVRPHHPAASPPSGLPGALRCRRKFLRQFPGGFRDATYLDWERDVGPIPEDAKVSLICGPGEMAKPS